MVRARHLAWVGLLAWAVSWFLPPIEGVTIATWFVDVEAPAVDDDSPPAEPRFADAIAARALRRLGLPPGPPGWVAFRVAWTTAFEPRPWEEPRRGPPRDVPKLLGFTCLTNFVMALAAIALLLRARGRTALGLGVALLACGAFDLQWPLRTATGFASWLSWGYWTWFASFVLAGLGFLARRDLERPGGDSRRLQGLDATFRALLLAAPVVATWC